MQFVHQSDCDYCQLNIMKTQHNVNVLLRCSIHNMFSSCDQLILILYALLCGRIVSINSSLKIKFFSFKLSLTQKDWTVLTMFRSTYTCKSSFSHVNVIKTNGHSSLSNKRLHHCLPSLHQNWLSLSLPSQISAISLISGVFSDFCES